MSQNTQVFEMEICRSFQNQNFLDPNFSHYFHPKNYLYYDYWS